MNSSKNSSYKIYKRLFQYLGRYKTRVVIGVVAGIFAASSIFSLLQVSHEALKPFDITPQDITDVVLTHLHFDHAGGIVERKGSGLNPAFPKARVWLQKQQWQWAQNPSRKDRASFLPAYIEMLTRCPALELIDGNAEIAPGISVIPFYGHTPAMQTVLIQAHLPIQI